jgi:hypothetical protein
MTKSRKGDNVPEQQEFDLGGPPGESFEDGQLTEEQANDLAQVLTSIPGFPNYRQVVRFGAKLYCFTGVGGPTLELKLS